MDALIVLSSLLVAAGIAFLAVSALGLLRLPDLYTRAHAVAKAETLGLLLVFGGLMLRPELDLAAGVRLLAVLVFSLVANPTAVHALVRAAHRTGALPPILSDQRDADRLLGPGPAHGSDADPTGRPSGDGQPDDGEVHG
jgi:multicomponent Na+:H+ antiporter subunit G